MGGHCIGGHKSFTCRCPSGYTGRLCTECKFKMFVSCFSTYVLPTFSLSIQSLDIPANLKCPLLHACLYHSSPSFSYLPNYLHLPIISHFPAVPLPSHSFSNYPPFTINQPFYTNPNVSPPSRIFSNLSPTYPPFFTYTPFPKLHKPDQ